MPVKSVYLIRHGETDFNREGRLQGTMPVPLNENGQLQAQALGLYLKRQPIDVIYTSPLLRARQTADLIGQVVNAPIEDDARLQEINFGQFAGLTYTDIKTQYANEYRMWDSGDMSYTVPAGESRFDVQRRMTRAWGEIATNNGHDRVALVSHGAALKILLKQLFYRLPNKVLVNTSVTTLTRFGQVWEIESFAETPHLND